MAARARSAGSREALISGAGRGDLERLVAHEPIHGEIIDLRGRSLLREGLPPLEMLASPLRNPGSERFT